MTTRRRPTPRRQAQEEADAAVAEAVGTGLGPFAASAPSLSEPAVPVEVAYCAAVDEFVVIVEDAPDIEIYELLEDLEVIFDANRPGALLGLTLRGARLGRPAPWTRTVQTVCGPTLWGTYEQLALKAESRTIVGDDDDDDGVTAERVLVPAEEWARLRNRTWLALHQSLHEGEWWREELQRTPVAVNSEDPASCWVIAAPWPRVGQASNIRLPTPLAEACGLEPVGYIHRTPEGLEIRFDIEIDCEAHGVTLQLADPYSATSTATDVGKPGEGGDRDPELVVTLRPGRPANVNGPLVILVSGNKKTVSRVGGGACRQRGVRRPDGGLSGVEQRFDHETPHLRRGLGLRSARAGASRPVRSASQITRANFLCPGTRWAPGAVRRGGAGMRGRLDLTGAATSDGHNTFSGREPINSIPRR